MHQQGDNTSNIVGRIVRKYNQFFRQDVVSYFWSGNQAESTSLASPSHSTNTVDSLCLRSRHKHRSLHTTAHSPPRQRVFWAPLHPSAFTIISHGHIHHDSLDLRTRSINHFSLCPVDHLFQYGSPHIIVVCHVYPLSTKRLVHCLLPPPRSDIVCPIPFSGSATRQCFCAGTICSFPSSGLSSQSVQCARTARSR